MHLLDRQRVVVALGGRKSIPESGSCIPASADRDTLKN